jgi:hypothetical protein
VSAAACAFAHVAFAVASAPHELVRVSQIACVMMSMFWAEPWLKDVLSTGWKEVSLRLSKPVANSICGTVHEPKLPIELDVVVEEVPADPVVDDDDAVVVAEETDEVATGVAELVMVTVTAVYSTRVRNCVRRKKCGRLTGQVPVPAAARTLTSFVAAEAAVTLTVFVDADVDVAETSGAVAGALVLLPEAEPNGKVFDCEPSWTVALSEGSKKALGSFAGSCA